MTSEGNSSKADESVLGSLREEIDAVDEEIVRLLGKRFAIVRRVAEIKSETGLPVVIPKRLEEVWRRNAEFGRTQGLNPDFVHKLYQEITDEACSMEVDLIDDPRTRRESR